MIIKSQFRPAWWLANAHFQTIAAKWLRRNETFSGKQTTLETPDDDFIDLVWTELPSSSENKPIVIILHGLAGSSDSHYAKGLLNQCKQNNWIGLLMHFRGCSGRQNRQGKTYHSGDIRDISFLTEWLKGVYPNAPLLAVGFSLGGNVLTKYLATQEQSPYVGACVICAPLDLSSCSQRISRGFSKVYQKYLVDMLKETTLEKIALQQLPQLCSSQVNNVKRLWDFDHLVTAPINGFDSAEHYYQQASGKPVITDITTNTLFIHAADDPFLDHQHIVPQEALPQNITFEVCDRGGHVGFITGQNPLKPKFWLEQRITEYLEQYI